MLGEDGRSKTSILSVNSQETFGKHFGSTTDASVGATDMQRLGLNQSNNNMDFYTASIQFKMAVMGLWEKLVLVHLAEHISRTTNAGPTFVS